MKVQFKVADKVKSRSGLLTCEFAFDGNGYYKLRVNILAIENLNIEWVDFGTLGDEVDTVSNWQLCHTPWEQIEQKIVSV